MTDSPKLRDAKTRTMRMAVGLQAVLGPVDAAGVLVDAAVTLLIDGLGPELATRELRALAEAVERYGADRVALGQSGHA